MSVQAPKSWAKLPSEPMSKSEPTPSSAAMSRNGRRRLASQRELFCRSNSKTMITVGTFSKPVEAHLLRMRLEAGGVIAYIQNENMVQMDWAYSNAIGGVRVQIADADPNMALCPKCGSRDSAPDELPRRIAFLTLLLLSFPFLFSKTRWKCNICNHIWNESKTAGS